MRDKIADGRPFFDPLRAFFFSEFGGPRNRKVLVSLLV
jgi:hypothetical protein